MRQEIVEYLKSKGFHETLLWWYESDMNGLEIFVGITTVRIWTGDIEICKISHVNFKEEFENILIEYTNI